MIITINITIINIITTDDQTERVHQQTEHEAEAAVDVEEQIEVEDRDHGSIGRLHRHLRHLLYHQSKDALEADQFITRDPDHLLIDQLVD